MTGIEISLLIIGCVFMLGSFFVSEKLSVSEIDKIAGLSDTEWKRIIEKGMKNAESRMDSLVEEKMEEVSEKAEIAMEKESNLKIMAIQEYSDTIFESMTKTHEEIMFLYSMLNDKHTEMTSLTGNLQRLAADIRNLQEGMRKKAGMQNMPRTTQEEAAEEAEDVSVILQESGELDMEQLAELENHNDRILALYKEGVSKVEIAKQLNLGVGEVNLVIGLYKGDK